jgi:uncharacterized membrane protein YfcA
MSLTLLGTLILLGGIAGFAAGLLGVGGGILLFPLLLYVPPFLGLESIGIKTIAALVVAEVFFATLTGGIAHWRSGHVERRLTLTGGLASAGGSFFGGITGGVLSRWVSDWILLLLFGSVALVVAAMMFLPAPSLEQEQKPIENVAVPVLPFVLLSGVTGVLVGLQGSGNLVFVPLLIYVFQVPTRIAIGSSLFIAMLNTFSGFLGKLLTGQIPFLMAAAVVVGASLGALGGEWCHARVSPRVLRYLYAGMVGVITLRIWITLLS